MLKKGSVIKVIPNKWYGNEWFEKKLKVLKTPTPDQDLYEFECLQDIGSYKKADTVFLSRNYVIQGIHYKLFNQYKRKHQW